MTRLTPTKTSPSRYDFVMGFCLDHVPDLLARGAQGQKLPFLTTTFCPGVFDPASKVSSSDKADLASGEIIFQYLWKIRMGVDASPKSPASGKRCNRREHL
jgi:hypothetical protein